MPRLRPDALFVPKVSWTPGDNPTAVSYGALVGTPAHVVLLPRAGSDTAGFTLSLQWLPNGASADDIASFVAQSGQPIAQIEATLIQSIPQWPGRCVFPIAQLSRFEILKGWKLWLGVSAVLQVGAEPPTSLRVPDKGHLEELRQMYAGIARV